MYAIRSYYARFFVEGDAVRTQVVLPRHVNGYKDIVHGGVIAALLDESMGWAATVFGERHPMYLTGELTLKYLSPVPVGEEIEIVSRLEEDSGRIAYSTGELFHRITSYNVCYTKLLRCYWRFM